MSMTRDHSINLNNRSQKKARCSRGRWRRGNSSLKTATNREISRVRPTKYQSGTLAFYEKNAHNFCGSTKHLNLNKLYAPFLTHLPAGAHILDAGCGSGRDTKAFLAKGYHVKAIDLSPQLARIASSATGQRCQIISFYKLAFQEQFHGIWACASVLHVPHDKCHSVLRRFARALKHQGVLYVSLKEGRGEEVVSDGRFFSYYNSKEFSELLTCSGIFTIIRAWKSHALDSSGKTQNWLNFLAQKTD